MSDNRWSSNSSNRSQRQGWDNNRGYSRRNNNNSNDCNNTWNRSSSRGNSSRGNSYRDNNRGYYSHSNYQANNSHQHGRLGSSHSHYGPYRNPSNRDMDEFDDEEPDSVPKRDTHLQQTKAEQYQSIHSRSWNNSSQIATATSSRANISMTPRPEAIVTSSTVANKDVKPKWEEMTMKDKIRLQLSSAHYDFDKLPQIKANPHKERVEKEKKEAFNHAIQKVQSRMRAMCNDDDSDDDDDDDSDATDFSMYSDGYEDNGPYSSNKKHRKELKYSQKEVVLFFKSLMNNVVFDMGFQVWGVRTDDDKNCWCPCGKHMKSWRDYFVVEHLAGKGCDAYCDAPSKMTPLGLMGHLRKKGENCPLHYGMAAYLTKLYGNVRGTGHKGLYMMGDKNYKAAEAAEKREVQNLLMNAIKQKEEAERRAQAAEEEIKKREKEKQKWIKKLERSNPDYAVKMKALEDNFKLLNLEGKKEEIDDLAKIDETKKKQYDELVENLFTSLLFGVPLPKVIDFDPEGENKVKKYEKNRKILEVEQTLEGTFDINAIFEAMEKKKGQVLFKVDKMEDFVLPRKYWIVRFSAFNLKDPAAEKNENRAIDLGGPTREFFSKVWDNLEHLCLTYHINKEGAQATIKICLFQTTNSGLVPTDNDVIEYCINIIVNNSKEKYDTILRRVKMFYRVVGLLQFRAIITQIPIASHIMPNFYRDVFLRNVEPKDVGKYSKRQMLIQLTEIGGNLMQRNEEKQEEQLSIAAEAVLGKSLKELYEATIIDSYNGLDEDTIIDLDNFFTFYLQSIHVNNKSIAINALKEGLSLDGKVNLQTILAMTSLSYVSEKFFGTTKIEAEELIDRLSFAGHIDLHRPFFDKPLKEVIREMTYEERANFTSFCTGYNYLPQREKEEFKIVVEFSFDEMTAQSLPVSHTCVNTLKLPGEAYGNDKELFKSKLFEAMASSQGFSMT